MQRRYLCVWFPMFALNRWHHAHKQQHTQVQKLAQQQVQQQAQQQGLSPSNTKHPNGQPDKTGFENASDGFALIELDQNARRLMAIDSVAQKAGLSLGMGLSDARAIMKNLRVEDADPEADQRALIRLAHWARRWCPWSAPLDNQGFVFTPGPCLAAHGDAYGLMLDITGSAHLFGGEETLLKDIKTRFTTAGYKTRVAAANSLGGAYALARYGAKPLIASHDLISDLAALPVDALRLQGAMLHSLYRLGLKTIGQLAPLPRPALARRFRSKSAKEGAAIAHLLTQLDRTLARQHEPLKPLIEPVDLSVRLPLMEPLSDSSLLMTVLADGLDSLLPNLEEKGLGLRLLTLTAYRTDGSMASVSASCARASLDKNHIIRLFKDRIDHIDAGFGIEVVVLAATRTAPLKQDQRSTLDDTAKDPKLMDQLADRISARLGASAVMRFTQRASWAPERMQGFRPWLHHGSKPDSGFEQAHTKLPPSPGRLPPRPARLLPRPEPIEVLAEIPDGAPLRFRWRRRMMAVKAAEGPERIAPEWWLAFTGTSTIPSDEPRDYFRAEATDGSRFWLYRRGLYPHRAGLEAQGHDGPRWFVHGFFA